jgi:septal ring factor EnvC (AmiA/AmiB activator)
MSPEEEQFVRSLHKEIANLKASLASMTHDRNDLRDALAAQRDEIADLKAQIKQDEIVIEAKMTVIDEQGARIAELVADFTKRIEWEGRQWRRCTEKVQAWKDKAIEERAIRLSLETGEKWDDLNEKHIDNSEPRDVGWEVIATRDWFRAQASRELEGETNKK